MIDRKPQIQEAKRVTNRINTKINTNNTSRPIIFRLYKTKDRENLHRSQRGETPYF